jgi:hypothetical protein
MNGMGLSLSEICCLFCCPPCPSKIAAKLAFLPPEPTYTFEVSTAGRRPSWPSHHRLCWSDPSPPVRPELRRLAGAGRSLRRPGLHVLSDTRCSAQCAVHSAVQCSAQCVQCTV